MFLFKQSIKLGSSSYPQGLTGHKVTASVKTTKNEIKYSTGE